MQTSQPDEVYKAIWKLKNTGNGLFGPTRKIYKTVANIISSPICNILNQIVLSGIYLSLLKEACETPIFKSGDNFKIIFVQ